MAMMVNYKMTDGGSSNSTPYGETAAETLAKSLSILLQGDRDVSLNNEGFFEYTRRFSDPVPGAAGFAASDAIRIAEEFREVNGDLANSWETVSKFMRMMETEVNNKIRAFVTDVNSFAQQTIANEQEILTGTNTANEKAEEILSRLGLN